VPLPEKDNNIHFSSDIDNNCHAERSRSVSDNLPLCFDLDGTLISTDTLLESILLAVKIKPILLLLLPFWILRGKLFLKNRIGKIVIPNPALLPYRIEVLDFLRTEKEQGRKIVLVSATIQAIADSVAGYLGVVDEQYGSGTKKNLLAGAKADILVEKFGEQGFDYVGDSASDIPVWNKARCAYIVGNSKKFASRIKRAEVVQLHKPAAPSLKAVIKQLRIYQWVKNVLLFFPLAMAHSFQEPWLYFDVFIGFIAMGLIASSVYVINDMLDLESDRQHPRKRFRPLACGIFSLKAAIAVVPLLLFAGFCLTFSLLPLEFSLTLLVYFILTFLYSVYLKSMYIVDVLILSILYTLRLIAGAFCAQVYISPWLLDFSMFIFLSLAIVKRYTEMRTMRAQNKSESKGRGYLVSDIDLLLSTGIVSGFIAVLVFTLYIHGNEVVNLYNNPNYLWPVSLCILFWIMRIWFKAHRGEMHDDPIVFTVKDKFSYFVGLIIILFVVAAIKF
jgi:4-hydroxybenzoate polyprenyltransferase/phosphoserine phosphatase